MWIGTKFNDTIVAGSADDSIVTGGGNDSLVGGSGNDTFVLNGGNNSISGGTGAMTVAFNGNAGGNVQIDEPVDSGNNIIPHGPYTLDFSGSGSGVNVNLNTVGQQTLSTTSTPPLTLSLSSTTEIQNVVGTSFADDITANSLNDRIDGGGGNDTFNAGAGNDTFVFTGAAGGNVQINDPVSPHGSYSLDFSGYGAGIDLDLGLTTQQTLAPAQGTNPPLTLTLASGSMIQNAVGTPYADVIVANTLDNTIIGRGGQDSLVAGSGTDFLQAGVTQVVLLDFDTDTDPVDHQYTPAERSQIVSILENDFQAFDVQFTQSLAQAQALSALTGSQYITLYLNGGGAGGESNSLDFGNQSLGGQGTVNVNDFIGGANQPAANSADYVNLTAEIIAHETGHMMGLLHSDSYGPVGIDLGSFNEADGLYHYLVTDPESSVTTAGDGQFVLQGITSMPQSVSVVIGTTTSLLINPKMPPATPAAMSVDSSGNVIVTVPQAFLAGLLPGKVVSFDLGFSSSVALPYGIYSASLAANYSPEYAGALDAYQTPDDIMASPASVGTTLFNAAGLNNDGTIRLNAERTQLLSAFGAGDLIKLAFADTGTTISEQNSARNSRVPDQPASQLPSTISAQSLDIADGALPGLTVPVSTLEANPNIKYAVSAIAVNGSIEMDPSTGMNYVDYYTFRGTAGDLMNFQVLSTTLSRTANAIDAMLSLYDPTGKLIASNDDDFESLDPSLVDQVLPMDGTYTIEVSEVNTNQSGAYTLFLYRFAKGTDVEGPGSGSTLVGGTGSDQFIQDSGTDQVTPGDSVTTVSLKIFSGVQTLSGAYQIEEGQTVQLTAVGYSSTYHDQLTYSLARVPDGQGDFLSYPTDISIDAATGAIQWPTNSSGTYYVRVTVTSAADGDSASTDLEIDVESVSTVVPTANNDTYSTIPHDRAYSGSSVLANDNVNSGDSVSVSVVSNVSHGSLTLNANGTFSYAPAAGYLGSDGFTYEIHDATNSTDSNTATVNLTVVDPNAPVAVSDTFIVAENGSLTVLAASGVLHNDSDADSGDTLTAAVISTPSHGSLTFDSNGDGGFVYTPAAGFSGSDSFTYQASDGARTSAITTVTLNVTAAAPAANNDTYSTIPHDRTYSGSSVLANDNANSGDSLTASVVSNVSHGSLTLNTNGTFDYTPAAGYLGSDSFTYKVHDATNSTDSNTATVSLTVVDPNAPVAVADSYDVAENGSLTVLAASGMLHNDSDADSGDTLTAVLVSTPSHGSLTFDSNGDGGFVYTPASGYFGTDTFTYQASDGSRTSAVTTVTIHVIGAAPTANDDTYSTIPHDRTYSGSSVLANDTANSGDSLSVSVVSNVSHGSLTLNANGTFSYTPAAGYLGSDSFTYKVHDATNSTDSNTATVSLTVVDPNAPVAVADSYTVAENGSLTVLAASGVLHNDSDADSGDTLTAALISTPSHGSLTFDSNGDGGFIYTPNSGYFGSDSFTYQASDGARTSAVTTVTLNVTAAAPTANNDTYSNIPHDRTYNGSSVLANDNVNGSDSVSVSVVSNVSHGSLTLNINGTFSYTPAAGYLGNDSFTYKVHDATNSTDSNTATVSLTVVDPNAPVAVADNYSVAEGGSLTVLATSGVLSNDSDADSGDTLTAAVISTPSHGSLTFDSNGDGGFVYTPAAGFSGSDSFTYQASDGARTSAITTVTLNVTAVAPTANNDAYSTIPHDRTYSGSSVLANDTANSGDSLTASVVSNVSHGSLTLNANGTFSYTPAAGYLGSDSFTYKIHDATNSTDSNTATVSLTVVDPNAPVAVADSYTVAENGSLTVLAASGVLHNDSDADSGDTLTAALISTPSHGSLTFNSNGDGGFVYTPAAGFFGSDSFTYQASDGARTSAVTTVTIGVVAPPTASNSSPNVSENASNVSLTLTANDPNNPARSLTYTITANPQHGTLGTVNGNTVTYTPTNGYTGPDSFQFKVNNGVSDSNTATVSITVKSTTVLAVGSTYIIPAYQGLDTGSVTLATFTDSTTATPSASTYSATINWQDGTTDSGSNVTISVSGSSILVTGRHIYSSGGAKSPTVTLTKAGDSGVTATATVNVSTDVTSTLKPTASGLSYNRSTKLYGGTMTLTNSTSSDITSTGYTRVVLEGLSSQITVTTDYAGASVGRDANGDLYLLLPTKKVAKNSSLTFNLYFNIPTGVSLNYTPEVFVDTF